MNGIVTAAVALALGVQAAAAQQPDKAEGLPKFNDALQLAWADHQTQPEYDRLYLRYLWVMGWDDTTAAQALSDAVNRLSRSAVIKRPVLLGKDRLMVVRVNLRHYARLERDLEELSAAWEAYRFDPRWNLLLTRDTVRFALRTLHGEGELLTRRSQHGGKIITEQVTLKDARAYSVFRAVPDWVDAPTLYKLQDATYSVCPVVSHDYFVARALATIRDEKQNDGLFAALYGGLYYDFAGIPDTLDKLLEQLGVGVAGKVSFRDVFDKLGGDRRSATFRSKVAAGRPRRELFVPILKGDVFDPTRFFAVTDDFKRSNFDIGKHPLMNLLGEDADAHEGIWTLPNGMLAYGLWNGKGERQEKAPDDVVRDHTVAAPFYGELQGAVCCMACHEAVFAHDGWQPLTNDVQALLRKRQGRPRLDLLDDLSVRSQTDALARIEELYQGDPERLLRPARDAFARAVLTATGPWKASKDQTDVIKLSSGKLVGLWRRYFYDDITPRRFLLELGWDVPDKIAQPVLEKLLPPVADPAGGFVPEDPRVAALTDGIPIGRYEADLIYSFAVARMQTTLKDNPGLLKGEMK